MVGKQLIADFFGCSFDVLNQPDHLKTLFCACIRKAGATIIDVAFHHFSPQGVSGIVVLQESHVAVHTWPELGFAAIDIFTCGSLVSPDDILWHIQKELSPRELSVEKKGRGSNISKEISHHQKIQDFNGTSESVWFTERGNQLAISFKLKGEKLFRKISDFQLVEVMETHQAGRVLALDGWVVWSEQDQSSLHEMMALIPMAVKGFPSEKMIILGGGDGGLCKELVDLTGVKELKVIEQDPIVLEAIEQFFPENFQALNHSKVDLMVGDLFSFLSGLNLASSTFFCDFLVSEISDQNNQPFERLLNAIASSESLSESKWVIPLGNPFINKEVVSERIALLKSVFGSGNIKLFGTFGYSFLSGYWLTALVAPSEVVSSPYFHETALVSESRFSEKKYFNKDIFSACWVLPNQFKAWEKI